MLVAMMQAADGREVPAVEAGWVGPWREMVVLACDDIESSATGHAAKSTRRRTRSTAATWTAGTLSAIQITTAAAICTALDLARDRPTGAPRARSPGRHSVEGFLENRFCQVYTKPETGVRYQSFGGSER
jgi:hypothetical protein